MLTMANELQSLTRAVAADEDARKHKHHRLLAAGHDNRQFLLNALADLADYDFTYVGGEANTEDQRSLWNRVRRAREVLR